MSKLLPGREVPLGKYTTVQRLLPHRERRTVGAWCFLDHFGPQSVINMPGMQVPPHPHMGLQTVTWLLEGEVLHRDSLGSLQTIHPGQLNLMTAGYGIAHSEESPAEHPPSLHGLQLWVALPAGAKDGPARFDHHEDLPGRSFDGGAYTVVMGEFAGQASPAAMFSPLVGVDLVLEPGATFELPLRTDFEYAVVVMAGSVTLDGTPVEPHNLLYLGDGAAHSVVLAGAGGSRLFLIGGEPFEEELVMWWNFVGRSHEDIAQARAEWTEWTEGGQSGRFGVVHGYAGDPLPAPALPTTRLTPRGRAPVTAA